MSTLEKAIVIATQAHNGQVGKDGNSYILHPLRVMMKQRKG
jgi:GTP diphosphokinase / guanosine-3',5'-bis(diphosphate) 3'-diphosphatase